MSGSLGTGSGSAAWMARFLSGASLHLLSELLLLIQNRDATRFRFLLHAQLVGAPGFFAALLFLAATNLLLLLQLFLPQLLFVAPRLGFLARFLLLAQLLL